MDKAAIIRDMEMALRAALAASYPAAHFSWKRLFGGAGFFIDGRIFAAWFGAELALKLPDDAIQQLVAQGGSWRQDMGKYVELPPGYLDQPDQLEPWVARTVAFVLSTPSRKRRKIK